MNEQIPGPLGPEEIKRLEEEAQIKEGEELSAEFLLRHPETIIKQEDKIESGPEIAEYKEMISMFESKHSLEALLAITELSVADAPSHPIRESARIDLIPIVEKLRTLSDPKEELKGEYKRLSRAVGIISNGKVDHTR